MTVVCPSCVGPINDPLYHGPIGHAPQNLCYECWLAEWERIAAAMADHEDWGQLDSALFLLCQGFSREEAADLIGVTRKTIYLWIRSLRRCPADMPEWFLAAAEARRQSRAVLHTEIAGESREYEALPRVFPPLPPGVPVSTANRIPQFCIEDVAQEAWVAHLSGQDPNVAIWKHVRQFCREARKNGSDADEKTATGEKR